jgi:Holliday junction resolvase RusA-like endonuclease
MKEIRVFVPGEPKAQPRARSSRKTGRHYNPSTADAWKLQVKAAFIRHNGLTIEGPIECDLAFYLPRTQRLNRAKDPDGLIPHIAKPDKDNLEKAVFDCLSAPRKKKDKRGNVIALVGGISVWKDDAQVWKGETKKYYAKKGGESGAWVTIRYEDQK